MIIKYEILRKKNKMVGNKYISYERDILIKNTPFSNYMDVFLNFLLQNKDLKILKDIHEKKLKYGCIDCKDLFIKSIGLYTQPILLEYFERMFPHTNIIYNLDNNFIKSCIIECIKQCNVDLLSHIILKCNIHENGLTDEQCDFFIKEIVYQIQNEIHINYKTYILRELLNLFRYILQEIPVNIDIYKKYINLDILISNIDQFELIELTDCLCLQIIFYLFFKNKIISFNDLSKYTHINIINIFETGFELLDDIEYVNINMFYSIVFDYTSIREIKDLEKFNENSIAIFCENN